LRSNQLFLEILYNLSGYRNRNIWLVLLLCKCSWLLEEIFFRLPESASLGIKWLLSGHEGLEHSVNPTQRSILLPWTFFEVYDFIIKQFY